MALEGLAHPLHLGFKQLLALGFIAGIAKPGAPRPKEITLQLAQLQQAGMLEGQPQGAKRRFQHQKDAIAFGDQLSIDGQGGQHP